MLSPTASEFDTPPVSPTLPHDPSIQDYERAIQYERHKLAQIRKTSEQLRAEYAHLNGACDNAMTGQDQVPATQKDGAVNKESQTPGHSNVSSSSCNMAPNTPSTGHHVRRKSSLNAAAPEFIPSFMGGKKTDSSSNS